MAVAEVRHRITAALERSGRSGPVEIVAVSKGHPPEAVEAAAAAGTRACGENRVAELEAKVEAIGRSRVAWHFVGHLQRNKVRRILPLIDLLHSLDSLRLAEELSREAVRAGVVVKALVQVNASGEATKGGFAPAALLDAVASIVTLPGLQIQGLMTMAPLDADEATLRTTFGTTRELLERCRREVPGFQGSHLSMGMSNDFEIAVEEGATLVRLGTILFGEREK